MFAIITLDSGRNVYTRNSSLNRPKADDGKHQPRSQHQLEPQVVTDICGALLEVPSIGVATPLTASQPSSATS
jgi:hypothetical protein